MANTPQTPKPVTFLPRLVGAGLLFVAIGPAVAGSLLTQLEELAKTDGFRIEGLDRLVPAPARKASGDAATRLEILLQDYNYMIVQGHPGRIEKVTITSLKQSGPKRPYNAPIRTIRVGNHHQVEARLRGPGGEDLNLPLLVDTGATTIVLPSSMIERLGFQADRLENGQSQTAGGTIAIKIGVLKSVQVGDATVDNVQVSFIADDKLNGAQLLGMSFLNRFRFSLDDENNELSLMAK